MLTAYSQTAIANAVAKVHAASVGDRHATVRDAALSLATIAGPAALTDAEIESTLLPAALAVGKPEKESIAAIRAGIRYGRSKPFTPDLRSERTRPPTRQERQEQEEMERARIARELLQAERERVLEENKATVASAIARFPWPKEAMLAESPVAIPEDPKQQRRLFLEALYRPSALLWTGEPMEAAAPKSIRQCVEWNWSDEAGPFICPAVLKSRQGGRKNENVAEAPYLILEHDTLPLADQAALLRALCEEEGIVLRAVIFTGGKSLHAWVERDARDWPWLLRCCGYDKAGLTPSQCFRLPGFKHQKTGKLSRLCYLAPGRKKTPEPVADTGPRCRLHPRDLVMRAAWNGCEVTADGGRLTLTPGPSAKGALPDWLSSELRDRETEVAAYLASLPPEPNPENLGAEAAIRRFLKHSACRVEGGDVEAEAEEQAEGAP